MKIKDGWYSQEAAKLFGTCFYETVDNRIVEVTGVCKGENYNFSDKINVGKVTNWVRDGRKGESKFFYLY